MDLLYCGFDGLDVSFQGRISHRLCTALEKAKLNAQKFHRDEFLEWCGTGMLVKEGGARGGYAFTVRTESPHAVWFFKKPNPHDPWGVRVSCDSFQLALHGFAETRQQLHSALDSWKVSLPINGESISRVDYAMDFLAPDLNLVPSNFVMHSNSRRADHYSTTSTRVEGKSGRVTSVTIGQMPGRQVIVYDKRAEVIAKHKPGWKAIWDSKRKRDGASPLDYTDPKRSRVWRVEVRAGKKLLKDTWSIRTWEDLDRRIGDVFAQAIQKVRYAEPNVDTNRARWPEHQLWKEVRRIIASDLFKMRNFAEPSTVKLVEREAYDNLLCQQIAGLVISRAALAGISYDKLPSYAQTTGHLMADQFARHLEKARKRLGRAADRYRVIM